MHLITFAHLPHDLPALAALGARELLVALPPGPASEPRAEQYLQLAQVAEVSVSFVVGDVAQPADVRSWDTEAGRLLLCAPRVSVLARRIDSLRALRKISPRARLALGPWPQGSDARQLRELGVQRLWAGRWERWDEIGAWVDSALGEGFELVVPVSRDAFVRAAHDASTDWSQRLALLMRQGTAWAFGVRSDLELEARCGLLMEIKTLLSTKSAVPLDAGPVCNRVYPYAQTEGFPQLYAELLRHPPATEVAVGGAAQALALERNDWPNAPPLLSVYAHVPFCVKRCKFCFCSSHGVRGHDAKRLRQCVEALCAESDLWARSALLRARTFHTLYVGGGSPSALAPAQLSELIEHLRGAFRFIDDPVVSIEMAPSSTSEGKLAALKRAGANRLSFGIQSFSDDVLARIGSAHDRKLALRALHAAKRAGFEDLDIDLLYGCPGQRPAELLADIDEGLQAGVSSIMLFPLHLTPGLLAWWAREKWDCRVWTAQRYHDFWDQADRHLVAAGYVRFGYSHYKRQLPCQADRGESVSDRYFSRYSYVMPGSDGQVALGPTALGCVAQRQYENVCGIDDYVQQVRAGHLPVGRWTEPAAPWPALVWEVIEQGASPGLVDLNGLSVRFGQQDCGRIIELLLPLAERGLFDRVESGFRTTRSGALWMANVQSEILRRAGLPSPLGHLIRL